MGEALPSLDTSVSPTPSNQTSSPERPGSPDVVRESSREELYFRTPSKPSRAVLQTASFYNGLDSSAGVKLLMSPAITGRVGRMKSYISTDTQVLHNYIDTSMYPTPFPFYPSPSRFTLPLPVLPSPFPFYPPPFPFYPPPFPFYPPPSRFTLPLPVLPSPSRFTLPVLPSPFPFYPPPFPFYPPPSRFTLPHPPTPCALFRHRSLFLPAAVRRRYPN